MAAAAVEKLDQGEAFKEEGNRYYGEGNWKKALAAYHKVFLYIQPLLEPSNPEVANLLRGENYVPQERLESLRKLKQSTRLNMAACYLKLGQHQKCVEACAQALEVAPSSKAHFRRGQALAELRDFAAARSDFERARALAPDDPAIPLELRKLKAAIAQGDERERQQYARMFGEAPPSVPVPAESQAAASGTSALGTSAADAGSAVPSSSSASCAEPAAKSAEPAEPAELAEGSHPSSSSSAPPASQAGSVVPPLNQEALDEARKPGVTLRPLTYAWQQTDEEVKVYVPFDQSEELQAGVDESQVQVEYGEWSVLLVIRSTVEGRTPLGLRLGDFHRRVAPEKCRCTVRGSRITLKLVKQEKEHWWNLLQSQPLHSG